MTAKLAAPGTQNIVDIVTYHGWGGYFFEDIDRIRQQFIPASERYHTPTDHKRYPFVRTPAPVVGVGVKLEDGTTHWGDAVAVSFGGKAGRSGPGSSDKLEVWFQQEFKTWCIGKKVSRWIDLEQDFLKTHKSTPPFVRYAISQALLSAACRASDESAQLMIAKDLGLKPSSQIIPLHGSSGANWDDAVDRMLARKIPYLPQGQFENIAEQIGPSGTKLLAWIQGFKERAARFGYTPTLTLDFHGALDSIFNGDDSKIADFIISMAQTAAPHALHVESPIVGKTLQDHAGRFATLRSKVHAVSPKTKLIADEWANELTDIQFLIDHKSVDGIHIKMPDTGALSECAAAVVACKNSNVFALLGGSCTESDLGARASVHLALACEPDALLVKPGMGFDESAALMHNEMLRQLCRP